MFPTHTYIQYKFCVHNLQLPFRSSTVSLGSYKALLIKALKDETHFETTYML